MTRVSFVVGDEKIDCPMTAGQMCEKTGQAMKYRVGPAVFDSAEEAVKAAAMAYGMAQSVAMSYEVDGKATTCSKTAAKMCNGKAGAMTYVVGQTKTRCNVQADHVLASERVSKALEALEMVTRQS
jgi:phosphopantothenate synthetase